MTAILERSNRYMKETGEAGQSILLLLRPGDIVERAWTNRRTNEIAREFKYVFRLAYSEK